MNSSFDIVLFGSNTGTPAAEVLSTFASRGIGGMAWRSSTRRIADLTGRGPEYENAVFILEKGRAGRSLLREIEQDFGRTRDPDSQSACALDLDQVGKVWVDDAGAATIELSNHKRNIELVVMFMQEIKDFLQSRGLMVADVRVRSEPLGPPQD